MERKGSLVLSKDPPWSVEKIREGLTPGESTLTADTIVKGTRSDERDLPI